MKQLQCFLYIMGAPASLALESQSLALPTTSRLLPICTDSMAAKSSAELSSPLGLEPACATTVLRDEFPERKRVTLSLDDQTRKHLLFETNEASLTHAAIAVGDVEALVQAVRGGADLQNADCLGRPALHHCASADQLDCLAFLLSQGTSPACLDEVGVCAFKKAGRIPDP